MRMCPYFGNVYSEYFQNDIKEIKDHGFNAIVHPVSEVDIKYHADNVKELIRQTKEAKMIAVADTASLGNIFGYGNCSQLLSEDWENRIKDYKGKSRPHICANSLSFRNFMYEWGYVIRESDWVMFDEPSLAPCFCNSCRGSVVPMVTFLRSYIPWLKSGAPDIKTTVCFWGGRIHPETYDIAQFVDDVGVSIPPEYYLNEKHVDMWLRYIKSLGELFGKSTSVWWPGYGIPRKEEDYIFRAVRKAKEVGIDHQGSWGFRGCEGWSYARCENPKSFWDKLGRAFREISPEIQKDEEFQRLLRLQDGVAERYGEIERGSGIGPGSV